MYKCKKKRPRINDESQQDLQLDLIKNIEKVAVSLEKFTNNSREKEEIKIELLQIKKKNEEKENIILDIHERNELHTELKNIRLQGQDVDIGTALYSKLKKKERKNRA